jgi:hypothetical protein
VGRSEAKPVAPTLQASLATNPRRKSPRPFGLRRGRAPAALRRSTDALRHRSSRRAWPIATPVRNADGSTWPDTALSPELLRLSVQVGCPVDQVLGRVLPTLEQVDDVAHRLLILPLQAAQFVIRNFTIVRHLGNPSRAGLANGQSTTRAGSRACLPEERLELL